jgi:hypothetical protein
MAEYQSEMRYGKKWYVGVVRKSVFRTVFPREETERGIATSQRAKAKGAVPLSSCVESVVENKGER